MSHAVTGLANTTFGRRFRPTHFY